MMILSGLSVTDNTSDSSNEEEDYLAALEKLLEEANLPKINFGTVKLEEGVPVKFYAFGQDNRVLEYDFCIFSSKTRD